jgi:hypothetical protein
VVKFSILVGWDTKEYGYSYPYEYYCGLQLYDSRIRTKLNIPFAENMFSTGKGTYSLQTRNCKEYSYQDHSHSKQEIPNYPKPLFEPGHTLLVTYNGSSAAKTFTVENTTKGLKYSVDIFRAELIVEFANDADLGFGAAVLYGWTFTII